MRFFEGSITFLALLAGLVAAAPVEEAFPALDGYEGLVMVHDNGTMTPVPATCVLIYSTLTRIATNRT